MCATPRAPAPACSRSRAPFCPRTCLTGRCARPLPWISGSGQVAPGHFAFLQCKEPFAKRKRCLEDTFSKGNNMLGTILLIILVIALLGGFSGWGGGPFYGTGYYGGGGIGLLLVIVVLLVATGRI